MEIKIIDKFLPDETFLNLKQEILSTEFPFFIQSKIVKSQSDDRWDEWFATHSIYDDYIPQSSYYNKIGNIFFDSIDDITKIKSLNRIQVNFYPHTERIKEYTSHQDTPYPINAAIFYINTCDGFTRLSDDTIIDSVENRLLLFDGSTFHNGTSTTTTIGRYIINFNFL